jgi:hypothetical protein
VSSGCAPLSFMPSNNKMIVPTMTIDYTEMSALNSDSTEDVDVVGTSVPGALSIAGYNNVKIAIDGNNLRSQV